MRTHAIGLSLLLAACGAADKSGDSGILDDGGPTGPATSTTEAGSSTGATGGATTPTGSTSSTVSTATGTSSTSSPLVEDCSNGTDDDDDGLIDCDDPDCLATCDADGDGFVPPEDCDDLDPEVYPGAVEICGDGIDQDCDGIDPVCLQLYAGDGRGGRGVDAPKLYRIDVEAGTVTELGGLELPLTGLTWTGEGRLLGVTATLAEPTRVVEITPAPLEVSVVLELEDDERWSGFAWRASDDGLYTWVEGEDSLHQLELETGEQGPPLLAAGSSGHCLAADADGVLYRLVGSSLYQLDPEAGTEAWLGEVHALPAGYSGQGCTFGNGRLYVAPLDAFDPSFGERQLYAIDVSTIVAYPTGIALSEDIDALAAWPL